MSIRGNMKGNLRNCSLAVSNIIGITDFFFQDFNTEKIDIKKFCNNLNTISKYIAECQKELYICHKKTQDDSKSFVLSYADLFDRTNIIFSSAREKAIFYINHFPNIREVIETYSELDSGDFSKEEKKNI